MKKLGNKGFTLVELMATIVLLSIIAGIASYSITTIISNSKEKNYQLLIKEIKNAVELYYQDCKFINNDCDDQITLGYLVNNGYLKGNSVDSNNRSFLVNPNTEVNISNCSIKYSYNNGNIIVEAVSTVDGCPTSLDYSSN